MNLKFWLGSLGAAMLGAAAFVAEMPPELQKQIAQPFPESQRGWLGIVFALCGYAAHHFASYAARNALVMPVSVTMNAPQVGMPPAP